MLKKLKGYMMPIAMTLGIVLHTFVGILSFIIPYLIFIMLLLTYVKMSWKDIKFTRMHLWLILIQILGSVGTYFVLKTYDHTLAQGAMICVLAPTATSAPVIVSMLKGNVASLTAYSIISNLTIAILAPLFFSYIGYNQLPFFESVLEISQKIGFLLVAPFVIALLISKIAPKTSQYLQRKSSLSFYLWSIALTIVTGRTVQFIIDQGKSQIFIEILIAFFALIICIMQFYFGRKIGRKYNDTVAGGQGLGQKNTVLAIWMAQMYLNPISSIGPGSYVLWQNLINSYQVWRKRKSL